tara:strand:+ start:988 stop:1341 length:354 start_codon:yes stop_codon:yes gene_type:complete
MKYFTLDEFDSPDLPNSGINMDANFLSMLDNARDMADIPFKINSGYRTKEHNSKVGGKEKSSHLVGKAADISCSTSRERWIIITALQDAGFNRIGIANNFIHIDSDENKSPNVIWTY